MTISEKRDSFGVIKSTAIAVACICLSILFGILVPKFDTTAVTILLTVTVGASIVWWIRPALQFDENRQYARSAVEPIQGAESHLAIPRKLYYLATVAVSILSIRPTSALTISDWLYLIAIGTTFAVLASQH